MSVAYSNDTLLLSNFVLPADKVDHDYYDIGVRYLTHGFRVARAKGN